MQIGKTVKPLLARYFLPSKRHQVVDEVLLAPMLYMQQTRQHNDIARLRRENMLRAAAAVDYVVY
jgi:hypothetical protein